MGTIGFVVAALVLALIVATAIVVVAWRGVSAMIDWTVYTFGNERSVDELERRRRPRRY